MNFFRRNELTSDVADLLTRYDGTVRRFVGADYPHPIRMRDWELAKVLESIRMVPVGSSVLDTGSFNTYLPLALAAGGYRVTASDLIWRRMVKSAERRLGLAPAKAMEAPFFTWLGVYRRAGVPVRNLNLTRLACPDASFDCIVALSVIEHITRVERSLSEMFRALAPGGRMLLTTDCAPEPSPFAGGVRYFSEAELERLLAPFPVTSPRNRPDFARENWCYNRDRPVVTAFAEITKPR
ncbi:MAG TPA: class I SAM-dependent methyltransferase [Opitutaceae bacterium]|nr:class I SAM-dependent methyltransferase [Opitutaceae bacterium]